MLGWWTSLACCMGILQWDPVVRGVVGAMMAMVGTSNKVACMVAFNVIVIGIVHPIVLYTAINSTQHVKIRAATMHNVNVAQQIRKR